MAMQKSFREPGRLRQLKHLPRIIRRSRFCDADNNFEVIKNCMPGRNILHYCNLLIIIFLLLAGCAGRPPIGLPVQQAEQEAIEAVFRQWREEQFSCPSQLDAITSVTFKAWIHSGTLSGFVQAAEPSMLKFTALNPLDQPMLVLATNGMWFQFASIPDKVAYEGPVQAEAFARYAPAGIDPEHSYYWLTGRLSPDLGTITTVTREEGAAGYWLDLTGEGKLRHRLLFDPRLGVVHRHLVVDRRDRVQVEVQYEDFQNVFSTENATCRWPAKINVETREHRGRLVFALGDWLFPQLNENDFRFEPPPGYDLIPVK
jgi:outer membrane lipoprotein-sorting protein